ncbi:MAG TPA: NADH-quinone oxidoreductase subunit D, partial [bacterium]|nr:NADH-quinone oxidoreductase subunit D [bacterium]
TEEYWINMGPQHPSTHGVLRLVMRLDGETVLQVVPHLGYIHRSIERMCEWDTYPMLIHFTDRMDYLSAMMTNWAYVQSVEKSLGIVVPERAEVIRVMVAELNRIASHTMWFGAYCMDLGAASAFFYGFREREMVVDLFEALCGQRLTYNYMRIGGVSKDLTEDFVPRVKDICETIKRAVAEYKGLVSANVIFQQRTQGIGILSAEKAVSYGASGPVLRGSGVKYDLRKDEPYSAYPRFQFDVPTGKTGDCWDRYQVRIEELMQSVRILEQAVNLLPGGPVLADVKAVRPPKGEYYARLETARGDMGVYFVSQGGTKPYRMKFRTACFNNLAPLAEISAGWKVADVVSILGSLDVVIPDIDR